MVFGNCFSCRFDIIPNHQASHHHQWKEFIVSAKEEKIIIISDVHKNAPKGKFGNQYQMVGIVIES